MLLAASWLLLVGCSSPGSVKPAVKIGLSAPFEGRYRDLGYEVLYAVRLAVRERNAAGGLDGRYLVEFVALNDFNEADEAVVQARKMYVDPGILGVLGGWAPESAQAAVPEYQRLDLAFLSPETDYTLFQEQVAVEPGFEAAYMELSGGSPSGNAAVWAYRATNRLLDAMAEAARMEGRPTRAMTLDLLSP